MEKIWNADLLKQQRGAKKNEQRLQKQLNAALKRQRKLEKERMGQDAKFKKLHESLEDENSFRTALLSEEELNSLSNRIQNEPLQTNSGKKFWSDLIHIWQKTSEDTKIRNVRTEKFVIQIEEES